MTYLQCRDRRLDLSRPQIMGILNVTPDSFSDGGRFVGRDQAQEHAGRMVEAGAAIIDIGGESTRPGARPVDAEAELDRVLPVLEAIRALKVLISVDTMKAPVMRAAIEAGAHLINDVNALQAPDAMAALSESDAAVCLMHMQGEPRTMQQNPHYRNVVDEVADFLAGRRQMALEAGIGAERIVTDPGFGFGKSLDHNLRLLAAIGRLREIGSPVLVGLSRKSMFEKLLGRRVEERMPASVAAALLAAQQGASIIRVHDVRETMDALRLLDAVQELREQ